MTQPHVTPVVAKLAATHGVNLQAVTGTGAGGRISRNDVLAAAGVRATARAAAASTVPQHAQGPAWSRNPLVDAARQENADTPGAPALTGQAPTLFLSGDLPPFTASGIDPQTLLSVPAAARHAMAAAQTAAAAMAILNAYGGPDGAAAAANDWRFLDGNLDYEARVMEWVNSSRTRDQQMMAAQSAQLLGYGQGNPWPT